jgi:hypothetical protein
MNNHQIEVILKRVMGKKFRGVFPSDIIPPIAPPYPYGFVVNTDKQSEPGRHWQAIWMLSPDSAEFFDSFGEEPRGTIKHFLAAKKIIKNNKKVQASYEISCGPFVVYFLTLRSKGQTMEKIVARLGRHKFVDSFVKLFVSNLTKL